VDNDEEIGDHGREDETEALEALLRYAGPCKVPSAYWPIAEGALIGGVDLTYDLSSGSTFVELFHWGLIGPLPLLVSGLTSV